jgi:hypothetical protein
MALVELHSLKHGPGFSHGLLRFAPKVRCGWKAANCSVILRFAAFAKPLDVIAQKRGGGPKPPNSRSISPANAIVV